MCDTQSSQFASMRGKQAGASKYPEEISNGKGSSKITSTKEKQDSKQEQEKHKVEKGQN